MRTLLALSAVCKIVPDKKEIWTEASRHIVMKCDKLLVLWDGVEIPLTLDDGTKANRGGTYDCIRMAKEERGLKSKDILQIHVTR